MAAKAVLVLCAQVLLVKSIAGSCIGRAPLAYEGAWAAPEFRAWDAAIAAGPVRAYEGIGAVGYELIGPAALSASHGGGLSIASASPVAPTGVSVISENAIEGALAVIGQLPFLGTVGLEGALPTAGSSAVSYGSGNGEVGILAEGLAGIDGYGYGYAGLGHAGLGHAGLGHAGLGHAGLGHAGLGYGPANAIALGAAGPALGYGPVASCGCGRVW